MRSIRTKSTMLTALAIILTAIVMTVLGIHAVQNVGIESGNQTLLLLCESGEKNLDSYFSGIEKSVEIVSEYAENDLKGLDLSQLQAHVDRVSDVFANTARHTNGILTYYYRIDPAVSDDAKGFWFVDTDGICFTEHEVTDISSYDTENTSSLVWFTVPKATGKPIWLPPYITDNLDKRVISYNVPIYQDDQFIGVIGIELDYTMMATQVNNIRLYENGYAFINDAEGTIIYNPLIDVTSLTPETTPKTPEGLLTNSQIIRYSFEGVEKRAVCMELINGMRLNVTVPVSEINSGWKKLTNIMIIVSTVLLIVFILLTMKLAGTITKPLCELTEAAEKVADGDYDVELAYHGDDEVGILSHAFNQLISRLKSYIHDLNDLNEKLKADNLTLEAATTKDSLTSVKNRFALRRDYEQYIESDVHIMMLDIDDFKKVNDTYGHSVGDYLLRRTGEALQDIFGADHSYRYGGDEFMIIIPDTEEEAFKQSLAELDHQLDNIHLDDKKMPVHFSGGYVYGRTTLQDDLRLMLRQADELLYKAKAAGKNAFIGEMYNRTFAEGIKKRSEEAFRHG